MITAAYYMGEGSLATAGGKGSTAGSVDLTFITLTEPEVPMKRIKLTQGKVALVDDADYGWLNQWKWCARPDGYTWYVQRHSHQVNGKPIHVQMHREIMGLRHGDKHQCDHRDRDGLNNQRLNLRVCSRGQNQHNRISYRGSSIFKGVSWLKDGEKWAAYIGYKNRRFHLGYFNSEIKAAKTYDRAATKYFGSFARLNFPGRQKT